MFCLLIFSSSLLQDQDCKLSADFVHNPKTIVILKFLNFSKLYI